MFSTTLEAMVNAVPGSYGAAVMGADGILVDGYQAPHAEVDAEATGVELSVALRALSEAVTMLELGSLNQLSMTTDRFGIVVRDLGGGYVCFMLLEPAAQQGRARYILRVYEAALREQLGA